MRTNASGEADVRRDPAWQLGSHPEKRFLFRVEQEARLHAVRAQFFFIGKGHVSPPAFFWSLIPFFRFLEKRGRFFQKRFFLLGILAHAFFLENLHGPAWHSMYSFTFP